jgi:hypothetical protein
MLQKHRTICEYCQANIEYKLTDLLRDRFDTIFVICPLCSSSVEVPEPEEIDTELIPIEGEVEEEDLEEVFVSEEED